LSTHQKERLEKIQEILAKLVAESAKGKLVVVEGKKDIQTLRDLGVEGQILAAKTGGKNYLNVIEQIERSDRTEVIGLLDFDRRGVEGTKRLQHGLERSKIKFNLKFWRELRGLVGREILCIESLARYLETLSNKAQTS
jgi:5S rRNA maturation endonuclease (ribonuclease M5)